MTEVSGLLEQWSAAGGDEAAVRRRMYRAPTPRERERWSAARGVAVGPEPAPCHDTGAGRRRRWGEPWTGMPTPSANGSRLSPRAVPRRWFLNRVVVPPRVGRGATRGVESGGAGSAVAGGHSASGGSNWNWKAARQYVEDHFGLTLSRSSCLTPYQVRGDVTTCIVWGLC